MRRRRGHSGLGITIGPVTTPEEDWTSDLATPENAKALELLINRFATLAKFPRVDVDGDFTLSDAEVLRDVYIFLLDNYTPDRAFAAQQKRDVQDYIAKHSVGRWAYQFQNQLVDILTNVGDEIEDGTRRRVRGNDMLVWGGVAVLIVGAAVLAGDR